MFRSNEPLEEREVRSDDPSLSPEANRLLTRELLERTRVLERLG